MIINENRLNSLIFNVRAREPVCGDDDIEIIDIVREHRTNCSSCCFSHKTTATAPRLIENNDGLTDNIVEYLKMCVTLTVSGQCLQMRLNTYIRYLYIPYNEGHAGNQRAI